MKSLTSCAFIATLLLGLSLSVMNVQAKPDGNPESPGVGQEAMEDGPRGLEALNLTADQIQKLKDHRAAQRKDMIKMRADMETKQVDLAAELGQDRPDQKKIEKLAQQMGEVHAQMIIARTESVIFLRSILTPEQKQRMDTNFMNPDRGFGFMNHGFKQRKH